MGGEYVTITEAAARLGVSDPALRRRVLAGDLVTFTNPRDRRSRLIRLADLEAYMVPRRLGGHAGGIGTEPRPP